MGEYTNYYNFLNWIVVENMSNINMHNMSQHFSQFPLKLNNLRVPFSDRHSNELSYNFFFQFFYCVFLKLLNFHFITFESNETKIDIF